MLLQERTSALSEAGRSFLQSFEPLSPQHAYIPIGQEPDTIMLLALAAFALQPAPLTHLRPMSYHPPAPSCQRSRHIDSKIFSPAYARCHPALCCRRLGKKPEVAAKLNDLEAHLQPASLQLAHHSRCVCISRVAIGGSFFSVPRPLPHTLAGNALGLLLVFRTNAAYDRFWEARKVWGVITSECRALASNAVTFMTPQQALPFLSLVAAFPVATKAYLRGTREKSDMRRLRALLQQEEYDALIPIVNKPQYILTRQRQLAWQSSVAGVNEKEREILLKSVSVLGECVSICERIFNVSATLQLEFNVWWTCAAVAPSIVPEDIQSASHWPCCCCCCSSAYSFTTFLSASLLICTDSHPARIFAPHVAFPRHVHRHPAARARWLPAVGYHTSRDDPLLGSLWHTRDRKPHRGALHWSGRYDQSAAAAAHRDLPHDSPRRTPNCPICYAREELQSPYYQAHSENSRHDVSGGVR